MLSKMSNYIDVIVPRGGKNLVEKVQKFSKVHVIGHLEGLCHIYIDKSADFKTAEKGCCKCENETDEYLWSS